MNIFKKILNYVLLVIDYPFVFYYVIQKNSKDRLSHHGKAFALIMYFTIFINYILDFTTVDPKVAVFFFLAYLLLRFYWKDCVKNLARQYDEYNPILIKILNVYSILLLFFPIYALIKTAKW